MRRWISLILMIGVLLSLPVPVLAADQGIQSGSITNPLFDHISVPESQEVTRLIQTGR